MSSTDTTNIEHLVHSVHTKPSFMPTGMPQTESDTTCTTKSVHNLQEPVRDYGATPRKKRADKAQQAEKRKLVHHKLEEAHPIIAVALMCNVSESFVKDVIINDFSLKGESLTSPKYQVFKSGCPIKELDEAFQNQNYIKVVQTEEGFLISLFDPDEKETEAGE